MIAVFIISGIVLLWYVTRESQKNNPNWARALNSTFFGPLPVLFKVFSEKKNKPKPQEK